MTPLTLDYPAACGAISLPLDLWLPPLPAGAWRGLVVHAHGGGFAGGRRRDGFAAPLAERLLPAGFAVASIDYRLKGTPQTPWSDAQHARILSEQARSARVGLRVNPQYCGPWFYMAVEDFGAAIGFLQSPSCGVDFTGLPVLAMGASAGGIAALSLAFPPGGWEHLPRPDAAVGISAAMVQPWRLGVARDTPALMLARPARRDDRHRQCPPDRAQGGREAHRAAGRDHRDAGAQGPA
jgi:acetyl esterase/lipase